MVEQGMAGLGWPPAAMWLAAALVLAILELVVPAFYCLFLSAAAVVGMLGALVGVGAELQFSLFGLAIVLSLALLRPRLLARMHRTPGLPSRTQALHGKIGVVTQAFMPPTLMGRVTVEGQDWAASSEESLVVHRQVEVIGADGIVLQVKSHNVRL